jgi:hypothetical protein
MSDLNDIFKAAFETALLQATIINKIIDNNRLPPSSPSSISSFSFCCPSSPLPYYPFSPNNIYTSENVLLSERDNWLYPLEASQNPCYGCGYFRHEIRECPNLPPEWRNSCHICWEEYHGKCNKEKRRPPFKNKYISPEDLLKRYIKGKKL